MKRAAVDIKNLLGPTDEFLTGMNLTYTDGDGNPVTNPTIEDNVNFEMAFDLPESVREQMQDGDYYTFTLPDEIKIVQNQSFPLNNANGDTYATAVVNVDGTVTITFNERVTEESNIHGDFHFSGKFDEANIPGPGDITIVIPGEEQIPGIDVTVRPDVASSVSKEGHFDKTPNPNQVIWNVDVNKDMNHITNATETENLPEGLTITGVKVYELQVDFDGNVIPGGEVEISTSDYMVDADGKVTFANVIDKPYRIEYTTDIDASVKPGNEGGAVNFTNDVTFDGDEIESIPAEASVTANYKAGLVKGQPNYHPEDQTFDWVINYNHNEFNIKESQATVHDTISGNMTLQDASVVLKKVTFDSNGNPQEGDTLVLGIDYNLVPAPDGKGFEIVFIGDVDYAVNIHYTTQVEDVIDKDTTYSNSVVDGSGNKDTESGTAKQQGLIKNIENVDYGSKTLDWVVDINKNNYQMENWTFTDTLSEGLTWVNLRFSISDVTTGQPLREGIDYTMTYDAVTNQIHAEFIGSFVNTSDTFRINYKTEYDADVLEQSGETAFKKSCDV
ncbi:collagen binding domain-containing protein [Listeria cornellensis]|uniref:collagen binding domain-containing protein n=1 Tax=Listeria cornellensis TaxID=1494961 RepID=UPI0004AEBAA0|nr:collagen binding domain-containing protein [Listeria cornellensis]